MTSDRIFNALAAYLQPLVMAQGGVFAPSETVAETLALLSQAPGKWRCILQWQREDDTGNRHELLMKVLLIVQQGRGLHAAKGSAVMGELGLLPRFNQAAAWLRAVYFANLDIRKEPLKQLNAYWLNDPSFPTRQIAGEFSIPYGLSPVTLTALVAP